MTSETNSEGRIFPLVEHFNWQRWGLVRRKIYSLAVGQSTRFAPTQKTSISSAIERIEEAYENTRRYSVRKLRTGPKNELKGWIVKRVQ